MISLIICSRQSDIPQSLKNNITKTIGLEYELIIIDNSENKFSIFQAYNEGVLRAKGNILCFMHEDILYHTQDWGEKVIEHFKDKKLGLIGVIGSHYLLDTPSTLFSTDYCSGKILQGYKDKDGFYKVFEDNRRVIDYDLSIEVAAIDGLWFCIPKIRFEKVSFDEKTFKGWHAYDIDICMQIIESGFEVKVVNDVLIEHSSYGNCDSSLYWSLKLFYNKWMNRLPVIRGIEISEKKQLTAFVRAKTAYNYQYKRSFKFYRIYKKWCEFLDLLYS